MSQQSNELKNDDVVVTMKKSTVLRESDKRKEAAAEYVSHLPPDVTVDYYMPSQLSGAIFCGHLVTDLDSIAGAIGAAELYGGTPARASQVNSETAFALNYWGVDEPTPIEDLLVQMPEAGVCLVDHQQMSQLNKSIDVRCASVVFHHISCLNAFPLLFIGHSHCRRHRSSCAPERYHCHRYADLHRHSSLGLDE